MGDDAPNQSCNSQSHKTRLTILALAAAVFAVTADSGLAGGRKSRASSTNLEIRNLENALFIFHSDEGRYPDPANLYTELSEAGAGFPKYSKGAWNDAWDQELIVRIPGRHGDYDIYSVGADGIDDDGAKDDISIWAGVNEGYYWKRYWPRGRLILIIGIAIALGLMVSRFWIPSRIILPISGIVFCASLALGCNLLRRPTHSEFNATLDFAILLGILGTIVFVIILRSVIAKNETAYKSDT